MTIVPRLSPRRMPHVKTIENIKPSPSSYVGRYTPITNETTAGKLNAG
jgi:hypothetical protein